MVQSVFPVRSESIMDIDRDDITEHEKPKYVKMNMYRIYEIKYNTMLKIINNHVGSHCYSHSTDLHSAPVYEECETPPEETESESLAVCAGGGPKVVFGATCAPPNGEIVMSPTFPKRPFVT